MILICLQAARRQPCSGFGMHQSACSGKHWGRPRHTVDTFRPWTQGQSSTSFFLLVWKKNLVLTFLMQYSSASIWIYKECAIGRQHTWNALAIVSSMSVWEVRLDRNQVMKWTSRLKLCHEVIQVGHGLDVLFDWKALRSGYIMIPFDKQEGRRQTHRIYAPASQEVPNLWLNRREEELAEKGIHPRDLQKFPLGKSPKCLWDAARCLSCAKWIKFHSLPSWLSGSWVNGFEISPSRQFSRRRRKESLFHSQTHLLADKNHKEVSLKAANTIYD